MWSGSECLLLLMLTKDAGVRSLKECPGYRGSRCRNKAPDATGQVPGCEGAQEL